MANHSRKAETEDSHSNIYLIVVYFFIESVLRHLWQLKTAVFMHSCLIRSVLFLKTHSDI